MQGAPVGCTPPQAHYLGNVMRMRAGDELLVFNGLDGEWLAEIRPSGAAIASWSREQRIRAQIRRAGRPLSVRAAEEGSAGLYGAEGDGNGVAALRPVMTRRTHAERVNAERMRANVIEAAEQCGVLRVPEIFEPEKLDAALQGWPPERALIFADEAAPIASPLEALEAIPRGPAALLIGPEGGFDEAERAMLLRQPFVHAISLGPRVMRADTAAVAALALVNAVLGDWR